MSKFAKFTLVNVIEFSLFRFYRRNLLESIFELTTARDLLAKKEKAE